MIRASRGRREQGLRKGRGGERRGGEGRHGQQGRPDLQAHLYLMKLENVRLDKKVKGGEGEWHETCSHARVGGRGRTRRKKGEDLGKTANTRPNH